MAESSGVKGSSGAKESSGVKESSGAKGYSGAKESSGVKESSGAGDLDLDAVLQEVGQFGRYQVRTYCLILLPIVFSAAYNSQYIFAAGDVDHRCLVPECESAPASFAAGAWAAWALPDGGARCERLAPLPAPAGACAPNAFHLNRTQPCDTWVYQHNNSIVSEFELGCQEWKRTLVGTIHSAGLFVALPVTGYISDTFGRRTTFVLTAVSAAAMGLIRSFSTGYSMYLVFEFLDAALGSGVYSTGFILALEMVGLNRRVLGGNIISSSYAVGQVLVALAAWGVPYWRSLLRVIYAPSLLFAFYVFALEESVRWLLSKGQKKEAARIIYKVAATNKAKLSSETIRKLTEEETAITHKPANDSSAAKPESSLVAQVVKSRVIMSRLCICSVWWMTVTFTYYGLSINSVSLAGNMYVNYILTSLVEIPGYCLSVLTLDRFGRKTSIMSAFFICGASLIAFPFVPSELTWVLTSLNLLGKLCISMAFSSIYIYTSELFPTTARHRLLAFCSMVGRVGSIVAPQTPLLALVWPSLPYLLFGVMTLTSGLLMLLTPETLRTRLPDTVAQAEAIASMSRADRARAAE